MEMPFSEEPAPAEERSYRRERSYSRPSHPHAYALEGSGSIVRHEDRDRDIIFCPYCGEKVDHYKGETSLDGKKTVFTCFGNKEHKWVFQRNVMNGEVQAEDGRVRAFDPEEDVEKS